MNYRMRKYKNILKAIFAISLIFVLALTITCCKKDKNDATTISGNIVDPYQNIALSNVKVKLYVQKIESGTYSDNFTVYKTYTTSSNGTFQFEIEPAYISGYKLAFEKDNYFENDIEFSSDLVVEGKDYNKKYELLAEAFLRLQVSDSNNPNVESVSFRRLCDLSCIDCCNDDSETIYNGIYIDTCKTIGGKYLTIEWTINSTNSPTVFHTDSVYCTPFVVTNFDITF
jgi:hypothetical protein